MSVKVTSNWHGTLVYSAWTTLTFTAPLTLRAKRLSTEIIEISFTVLLGYYVWGNQRHQENKQRPGHGHDTIESEIESEIEMMNKRKSFKFSMSRVTQKKCRLNFLIRLTVWVVTLANFIIYCKNIQSQIEYRKLFRCWSTRLVFRTTQLNVKNFLRMKQLLTMILLFYCTFVAVCQITRLPTWVNFS